MTLCEWYDVLNAAIPPSLSCEWDHDGVQCMTDPHRPVSRILAVLDVTESAVTYAEEQGIDLIISHHPLLFRPLYRLTADSEAERCLGRLAKSNIGLFSFHTRADGTEGGVCDLLAARLGLVDVQTVPSSEGNLLRMGRLPAEQTALSFAQHVKASLEAPAVWLFAHDRLQPVRRVAVLGGEGGDFVSAARAAGADVYVSGHIGYHRTLEACGGGMAMIEAGHDFTEREIVRFFAQLVKQADPQVTVDFADARSGLVI